MSWKFTGDRPVYLQIAERIRSDILRGHFPPGTRIHTVRELALLANVNPNTMQRALTLLEDEGILVCCGTQGRFVTDREDILEQARHTAQLELARECAARLSTLGMTMHEAAQLLAQSAKEEETCPKTSF